MRKLLLFCTFSFFTTINCEAQYWEAFGLGLVQGAQNFAIQQQRQQQQRQQEQARQRQLEKQRKENEVHEINCSGLTGYKYIYRGISNPIEGVKNNLGTEIIPLSRGYSNVCFHSETGHIGYFSVEKNKKKGACDITGKEIVPCSYNSIFYSSTDEVFKYQDSNGDFHELDVALDEHGKGCKPDPDRKLSKTKKTEEDGYVWYHIKDGGVSGINDKGARSIDGKTILPNEYYSIRYMNGYFIAQKTDMDFEVLYNSNGVCILPFTRQYKIKEIHPEEGWAKVSRSAPSGELVGVIDLSTSKEILPLRASCMIRYNKTTKRFETKANNQQAWAKTTYGLDVNGTTITSNKNPVAANTNTNTKSNGTSQTIIVEHQRQPQPVQVWVPCGACGNSAFVGLCQQCYGSGVSPYRDERCFNCKGNRKCTHCAGSGGRYVVQYQ